MNECKYDDWFTAKVLEDPAQPAGFQDWAADITQYKYYVILPDGENKINVRMYIDMNGTFDNGSYTNMLVNRYKDLNGL
jgi:hypothetical protein